MSGTDIALILTAAGTLISALASGAAVVISAINSRKLNEVKQQTNGMIDKTAEMAHRAGAAEGNIAGRQELQAEKDARNKDK